MATLDTTAEDALQREEEALAHAAAAGDGQAFATLYERYETRAYNLAYRVTGSADDAADATQDAFVNVMKRLPKLGDRELNFGSYLLTATRNACYDLMRKQQRSQPTDSIPDAATPVGSSGSGLPDLGDPGEDPDRNVIVKAQQDEIREANSRLPERQREALALFELEEMTYDEVAEMMDMNRNSVAQLISRARINLRDELRGTALASIAPSSPDCEHALPLIALAGDGQLDEDSADAEWLDDHIAGCDTCQLSREAMQEAGRSYRVWAPVAAAPLLFKTTMAKAAEAVGADWTDVIAEHEAARAAASGSGAATGALGSRLLRNRGRDALIAAGLAAVLLVVGFEAATQDVAPVARKIAPAADVTVTPLPGAKKHKRGGEGHAKAANDSSAKNGSTTEKTNDASTPGANSGGGAGDNGGGGSGGGQTGRGLGGGNTGGGNNLDVTPPATPAPTPAPDPTPPASDPPVTPPTNPTLPGTTVPTRPTRPTRPTGVG